MSQQDDEQSPGAKIAVLKNEIHHVTETVKRIETKLDNMAMNYVTSAQMVAAQEQANQKHREQDDRIHSLENWNSWAVKIVLGAVLTAILSLVIYTKAL